MLKLFAIVAVLLSLLYFNRPIEQPVTLVVERCSVFDSNSGRMLPDRTVYISGDRIVSVMPANSPPSGGWGVTPPSGGWGVTPLSGGWGVTPPSGGWGITPPSGGWGITPPSGGWGVPGLRGNIPARAKRIDGRGKYLLPGLIDAHVHLVHVLDFAHVTGDEVLPLYLAAGVTSVRSTGDEIVAATLVARFAESHPESSPRVFTCSPLLDGDPPIHRDVGRAVTSASQVPALFDDLERWNIRTAKIYAGLGRDIGRAVIEEGHRRGIPVTGHLGNYRAQDAVADGIDCLEHIWSVFNFIIPADVARQPGHRGRLNLANPLCEDLIARLVRHNTYVDPTLVVFRNMILLPDIAVVRDSPDNELVPARLREFWPTYLKQAGCPQGGPLDDRLREFAKFQELTGKLYRAGVPILVGTDSPEPQVTPGFSMHQELELLVESGMPSATVLQAATLRNAAVLKEDKRLGSIAPGKLADMILLTANPLQDIRNSRAIQLVIRGGKVSYPNELLRIVPNR